MPRLSERDRGPIALAERIFAILDQGAFTATYKYAVLLGLIDLCMEQVAATGAAPNMVTTRQLAEKIVELYWPHTGLYHADDRPLMLRQFRGRDRQAKIISLIQRFRREDAQDTSISLSAARARFPIAYRRLLDNVEWKLIQDPLPRLQIVGRQPDEFLYTIGWDLSVRRSEVRSYQRGEPSSFDNRILLRPNVGEYLIQLNALLRPLIHRQWAMLVARINGLEESRLQEFLFGADRIDTSPVRPGLLELQDERCFYCHERLTDKEGKRPQVDHFIPWARYPNNAIQNLVVSHERCNHYKSNFLAAAEHVTAWRVRIDPESAAGGQLLELAGDVCWEEDADKSLSVARAIYFGLPEGAKLWLRKKEFDALDPTVVAATLA